MESKSNFIISGPADLIDKNRTVAIKSLFNNKFWCNWLRRNDDWKMAIHPSGNIAARDCLFHFEWISGDTIRLRSVAIPHIALKYNMTNL